MDQKRKQIILGSVAGGLFLVAVVLIGRSIFGGSAPTNDAIRRAAENPGENVTIEEVEDDESEAGSGRRAGNRGD